jgi:hypothetical protein
VCRAAVQQLPLNPCWAGALRVTGQQFCLVVDVMVLGGSGSSTGGGAMMRNIPGGPGPRVPISTLMFVFSGFCCCCNSYEPCSHASISSGCKSAEN